jgi:hypothetical protein
MFLINILRGVLKKDKKWAKRINKYLEGVGPLVLLYLQLAPNEISKVASREIPSLRGKIKPKRLQNISGEYENIYKAVKTILSRKYRNNRAKLLDLLSKEELKDYPEEKIKEWMSLKPSIFTAQCLAYKHGIERHPETILRITRKEKKQKELYKSLADWLSKKLKEVSSQKFSSPSYLS